LKNSLNKLEGDYFNVPKKVYTDDTAMTKSVAHALIKYNPETYQKDLAKNFVREYFNSPKRGYGAGVTDLFHQLKRNDFEDVLNPALNQFGGRGSFGNGAAMRVSPVSLYCLNKSEEFLIDLVKKTSEITHANVVGVNGAILQALAIHKNLKMESNQEIDKIAYLDDLLKSFENIEKVDSAGIEQQYFIKQLNEIKRLLSKKFEPSTDEIINSLGHSVNALYSVPTALYCFLRNSHLENPLRKTLEFTISLGGDTDTIASMSCALIGSLHGDSVIASNLIKHCESNEEIIYLANELYEIVSKGN
jgi:poly(ADP-ribose) glycohydrolase ARH3